MEATQACSLTNGIVGRSGACLGLGARAEAGLRGRAGSRHRCVQCGREPEREWGGGCDRQMCLCVHGRFRRHVLCAVCGCSQVCRAALGCAVRCCGVPSGPRQRAVLVSPCRHGFGFRSGPRSGSHVRVCVGRGRVSTGCRHMALTVDPSEAGAVTVAAVSARVSGRGVGLPLRRGAVMLCRVRSNTIYSGNRAHVFIFAYRTDPTL